MIAADTSPVRLTVMKDNGRAILTGMASGLYLLGIELTLNRRLYGSSSDARQMFFEAIDGLGCKNVDLA
ncbi:hypothetical protein [Accumulibacter sp.]|uniref:hypothetical protein n=1 Tax=Accumulibacter sp. TaxID=2053492 RepID=UPI00261ED0BF|nr:hypothetical protein [Accumulibacter sp.]